MKPIKVEEWVPADNLQLEENALIVATTTDNNLVVAGPGAGKTELLAQKACFLLQTNTCKYPQRILAISFKRDAAFNLKERVKIRCGDELSKRFDSLTFDAFAKQLIDRFGRAIPEEYTFSSDYEIITEDTVVSNIYEAEDPEFKHSLKMAQLIHFHTASPLPLPNDSNANKVRKKVWLSLLRNGTSKLSFQMVMRLAQHIIDSNRKIRKYLQQTYSFVFLDEFQDTTQIQYDFFKSCFLTSDNSFTAVGDDKQRIMLWAGAQVTIFDDFLSDIGASRVPLTMNFRCAPKIVALLNHLTEHLLRKADMATPSPKWPPDAGECFVWEFDNPQVEMEVLLEHVTSWIDNDGVNPRDICILVKGRLSEYVGALIDFFNANGLKARDEGRLQDLLTQEVSLFVTHCLYLAFKKRAGESKGISFSILSNLRTEYEDEQLLRLEVSFSQFIKRLSASYEVANMTEDQIKSIIVEIVDYAGKNRFRSAYPAYRNISILDSYINDLTTELIRCYADTSNLLSALDVLSGVNTIPVMTVHKSKGLEYHTVIFVGLEDSAFWSFQTQPDEDKCTFFVALSRAKERVVFTFSHLRYDKYGRQRQQSTDVIQEIIDELEKSGLVEIEKKELS